MSGIDRSKINQQTAIKSLESAFANRTQKSMEMVKGQRPRLQQMQGLQQPMVQKVKIQSPPKQYQDFRSFEKGLTQLRDNLKLQLQNSPQDKSLEAKLDTAEKNLQRAPVLYEHYRLGNDVPGPRLLHRRGQNDTEKYRNTATLLHSIDMTWGGKGTKTGDLPLLYAYDKGHSAEDFLHTTGKIYDPIGVESHFKPWKEAPGLKKAPPKVQPKKLKLEMGNQQGNKPLNFLDLIKMQKKDVKNGNEVQEGSSLDQLSKVQNQKIQENQVEVMPSGHDMQSNFAWLLGAMHNGETFELVGPITENSLMRGSKDHENEASALLREIRALLDAGYQVVENPLVGTQQTPIITLVPGPKFDPSKVTLESLSESAPNTEPDKQELLNLEKIGIFTPKFDVEKGPIDLGVVNEKMELLQKQRSQQQPMDNSHGQNLEQVVLEKTKFGTIKGSDPIGVQSFDE